MSDFKVEISQVRDYLRTNANLSSEEEATLSSIFDTVNVSEENGATKGDEFLDSKEFSDFTSMVSISLSRLKGTITKFRFSMFTSKELEEKIKETIVHRADKTRVEMPKFNVIEKVKELKLEPETTQTLVMEEAKKLGVKLSEKDVEYWATKIDNVANGHKVPRELLIGIISKESGFEKNVNSPNGAGPMGITKIAITDFFPSKNNDWTKIYNSIDSNLLNDILYKKDANGKKVLKYKTPDELRKACTNDDELGMKVGLLAFEMNYVKAVATKKYGRATYANIPKVIKELQEERITLTEAQKKSIITNALKNYNSVFKTYAPIVVDSLARMGINFAELEFVNKYKNIDEAKQ